MDEPASGFNRSETRRFAELLKRIVEKEVTIFLISHDMGLVMDFRRLKEMLDEVTAELDNNRMTKLDYFQRKNASAENVAEYIHRKLEKKLPKSVKLAAVSVIEKRGCSAKYTKIR